MSYGKDDRDFDKHIWLLPVPLYDPTSDIHARPSASDGKGSGATERGQEPKSGIGS
jgi:hypothetical protein